MVQNIMTAGQTETTTNHMEGQILLLGKRFTNSVPNLYSDVKLLYWIVYNIDNNTVIKKKVH